MRKERCESNLARNGRREIHANIGSNIVMLCSCSSTRDSRFVPWRGFIIPVITVLAIVSAIAALLLLHRGRSRAHFPASQRPTCPIPIAIPPSLRPPPLPLYPNYSPPVFFTRYQIFHPHFAILQIRAVCFFNPVKVEFFFTRFPENLEQIRQLISTIRGGDRKSIV